MGQQQQQISIDAVVLQVHDLVSMLRAAVVEREKVIAELRARNAELECKPDGEGKAE